MSYRRLVAAPKTGVEFCQGSIATIRSSTATPYDFWQHRSTSLTFDQSEAKKFSQTHVHTHTESTDITLRTTLTLLKTTTDITTTTTKT